MRRIIVAFQQKEKKLSLSGGKDLKISRYHAYIMGMIYGELSINSHSLSMSKSKFWTTFRDHMQ